MTPTGAVDSQCRLIALLNIQKFFTRQTLSGIGQFRGFQTRTPIAMVATVLLCLSGCGSLPSAAAKDHLSVSVHGVNYTGNEFTYVVVDPANPANTAGGELVEPFAAGGTMCCFDLPKKWVPGITVEVRTTNFLVAKEDKSLSEVRNTYTVEVPPYTDGKAGELWVIRTSTGDVELVSSDYQPDHAQWPGKIKGWPTPSIEYRRARWEIYAKSEKGRVNNYKYLLARLAKTPQEALRLAWENDTKYARDDIKLFTGPSDPQYSAFLKQRYQTGLEGAMERLRLMEEQRP